VNWVTESWRLKLLALGLSVLMLGAVAFAQNPPTFRTLTVSPIQYTVRPNLIVINPPTRTSVRVTGLADTIQSLTPSSLVASFDLSKASPGQAVKVNLVVKSLVANVTVQNPSVPVALTIEQRATVKLVVQVLTPTVSEGWVVTKAEARCPNTPCTVNFDGPASWETNLKAYADFTAPVQGEGIDSPNVVVDLERNGTPLDSATFLKTVPNSSLDISSVEVVIQAKTGTTSRQVVLIDSPPSHGPPRGYRVTAITIDPIAVLISGKADVLAKVQNLTLRALDLSGHTSDFTSRVAIPYPSGVSGSVLIARVTYSISANPNAQPSPTPT
jgi:YbbR domain-containing protein